NRSVIRALAAIKAVQAVNAAPLMANANLTLGLWIQDSCSDVGTALRATEEFTREETSNSRNSKRKQPIMALIGAANSEISVAVARQLTLKKIPQISYASTAAILSDKSRFPAFFRTIPNDQHQTGAMVHLLSLFNWSWVGMVITDGDYGRSALDSFLSQTAENRICVAFKSILPESIVHQNIHDEIRQVAMTIYNNPKVKVIVSFAKPTMMKYLFAELRRQASAAGDSVDAVRRVWIASDSWSSMHLDEAEEIGHVIGFHFKTGNTESFSRFLSRVEAASGEREDADSSPELKRFYGMLRREEGSALVVELHRDAVFSVEMAVRAIAHAAVKLCQEQDCKTPGAVQPWQLLKALWTEVFELEGKRYIFDKTGDINLGYDVCMWRVRGGGNIHETVAEYHPHNRSFTSNNLGNIVSRCSNSCEPGQFKKTAEGQHTCCYECINCTENYYSNHTDMDQCLSCDTDSEWAPGGSTACIPKQELFFCWSNGFAIVLLVFSALGIVLALLTSALFLHWRQTPVVRAAGGPLSQVILYSLTVSFISAMLFVGRPNSLQCKARQVLFGISFTVCVSCILVKSLQILLAFQFNPALQDVLRKLYKPYVIVTACVAVQVATCISWLVLKSPFNHVINQSTTLLQDCHEGSYIAFGVMLGYIALLAFVCFVCAFKCRKLPQQYNEARFITFSMLLYLMSWLLFIPIYVTTSGVYLPAVEMVVILISNYGILSCHFFPKCYVILFKKDKNTRSAFRKTLYEYTSKSTLSISSCENGAGSNSSGVDNNNVEIKRGATPECTVNCTGLNQDSRQRRCLRRSTSI
uniref:G-protein coupled receptor family C group 6 member A n=1 Tax=Neogobius melanostomus TaxID=47308 RepID=A0A8C6WM60_9GOBI